MFGSHFAPAMDELFGAAERRGLNIISGLVLSDRILRRDLLNSPQTALTDSADLILRWHDRGRLRYAVTPRFSLSVSDEMLDVCAELLGKGVWFTSHINENLAEIATVAGLFPGARHYLDTYNRHGLVTARSVFAHDVHPGDAELALLAEHGASVAHCATSNSALGSGLFPLRRHVEHGVHVALGSDVGAGAGLFLPKEALQAYFIQQLLGADGLRLTAVHLLYLATRAGARALGLDHRVGDFTVGKDFDAVLAAASPGEHAGGQPPPRPRHDRRAGQDLHPGHPGGPGRGVGPGGPSSGVEPVPRRGAPLADQRHAPDGVMPRPPRIPSPLRNMRAIRASGRRICDPRSSTIISVRKGTHHGPFGMDKKRADYPDRGAAGSRRGSRSSGRWTCGRGLWCSTRGRGRVTRDSWSMCST